MQFAYLNNMKKFGIRMDGNESSIENTITAYLSESKYPDFKYLEIGAAGTVSMKAIYEIISENIRHNEWEVHGLDLPNGWSLDWQQIQNFNHPLSIYINGNKSMSRFDYLSKASLWLESDPRQWISNLKDESIDICFIDGCHGAPCVMKDFEAVKSKVKKNGIVFFHDAGEPEQGTDWQGHCNQYINVRKGIDDLGLLESSNAKINGWQFMFESQGSRKIGGDGNSCVFVRKI